MAKDKHAHGAKREAQRASQANAPRPDSSWWVPMLIGGVGVFVVFVGIPMLIDLVRGTGTPATTTAPVAAPATAGSKASSQPSTANRPASAETPAGPPPPPKGIMALLPSDNVDSLFSGNAELAKEFTTARDDLLAAKSPAKVRQDLESTLKKTSDNPGREHVLAALGYASLRMRDTSAAISNLDNLLQQFPSSNYAEAAQVMKLEARLMAAAPKEKGATLAADVAQQIQQEAQSLEQQAKSDDSKANARYVAASAKEAAGDQDGAVSAYAKMSDDFPTSPYTAMALSKAARIHQTQERYAAAVALYEKIVATFPTDPTAKNVRKSLRELKILGQVAPELQIVSWESGEPTTLQDLRGNVVLLNFWQVWCPHCKKELPHMAETSEKYKDRGLVILGATRDDSKQDLAQLQDFLQKNPIPYRVARVEQQSASDYAVSGIPAAALIDKKGIIRWRSHPGQLTEEMLNRYLDE